MWYVRYVRTLFGSGKLLLYDGKVLDKSITKHGTMKKGTANFLSLKQRIIWTTYSQPKSSTEWLNFINILLENSCIRPVSNQNIGEHQILFQGHLPKLKSKIHLYLWCFDCCVQKKTVKTRYMLHFIFSEYPSIP